VIASGPREPEGRANLLEPSVLSVSRIAAEFGVGRTAAIRYLGRMRANPGLVADGKIRLLIHRRKKKIIGAS
jgi:hypothetical protein